MLLRNDELKRVLMIAGPDFWPDLFPDFCAGTSQSPIDLNDDDDTLVTSTDDWVFSRYDTIPNQMIIKNNGHSGK